MTGKERLLRQFRKLQEVEVAIHKVTDWEPLTFEGYKSASEYFQDFQSLSKSGLHKSWVAASRMDK